LDLSSNTFLKWVSCENNLLSTGALNDLFQTLHSNNTLFSRGFINISNNPGSGTCDRNIATGKWWIVQ